MRRGILVLHCLVVVGLFLGAATVAAISAVTPPTLATSGGRDGEPQGTGPDEAIVQIGAASSLSSAPSSSFSSSTADNWWKFKHDNLNSGATTASAPDYAYLLWERNLGANPFVSSPAIVDGVAYIGSARTTGSGFVHALNISSGLQVWRYSFIGNNGTLSSPAVTADKVIVGFGDGAGNGGVVALNRADGQQSWMRPVPINCASSPAVNGNNVYIGCKDGKLYALNLANGNIVWEANPQSGIDSSPAVAYGLVFVANCPTPQPSCNSRIFAYRESNGSKAWEFSPNGGHVSSGGAVSNGRVFFGTSRSMEVIGLNATQGTFAWRRNITGQIDMTPSVNAGKVYVGTGNGTNSRMFALNEATGVPAWSYPIAGNLFSSPAVADGKVIFGTSEPSVMALNESTGTQVWRYSTNSPVFSSPGVYDNKIAFGDNSNRIYVLGLDTIAPQILSTYPTDNHPNFPVQDNFTVTFTEPMDPASAVGQYSLAPAAGNLTHAWDATNTQVTIGHSQPLAPERNYTLNISAGFKDVHGNPLASGRSLSFRTRDVTPPRWVAYSPTGNITDAPLTQVVNVSFDEPMNQGESCRGIVFVASAGGNTNKNCVWSPDSMNVTITPNPQWSGNNRYDVQVTKTATDVAGNPIANPTAFSFTTKDTSPPQVLNVEPAIGAQNVAPSAKIKVRFNELVDQVSFASGFTTSPTVNGSLTFNLTEAVFTPNTGLAGDTDYTVQLLGVKDLAGNAMTAPYIWSFRTKDTTPPAFVDSTPKAAAIDVPTNVVINLFFTEKMDERSLGGAVTISNVAFIQAKWNDTTDRALITPGSILEEGKTYYLNISGAAEDVAGNRISNPVTLWFSTVKKPNGQNNTPQPPTLLEQILSYWPFILVAVIILVILAAVIPSKRYLQDYYGVSDDDLKKNTVGEKRQAKQENCEVCSLSLERDDYTKCKHCGRASHVECLAKVKKCMACREPI